MMRIVSSLLVMDQAICTPLMAANGVEDVYDLDDAPQIEIEKEDLFQIYVKRMDTRKSDVHFQMKKNELAVFDDAWLYRTANKIARQHACALSYDDYREDTCATNLWRTITGNAQRKLESLLD
jgi:hypothetical protein